MTPIHFTYFFNIKWTTLEIPDKFWYDVQKRGGENMHDRLISELCQKYLLQIPQNIQRCSIGQGNYVYIVTCDAEKYVFRFTTECAAYESTVHWLKELASLDIPVPKVVHQGTHDKYSCLILTYIKGEDIGFIYPTLSSKDKKAIAKEIVSIQSQVSTLTLQNIPKDWHWRSFVCELLERAEVRILQNGYFDVERVKRLWEQMEVLSDYFDTIQPVAYLDDISSKNLLIHNGNISGIIDVDWIGMGDKLTYVALTNMALLNLEYDTDYVSYILEEMHLSKTQQSAFLFYTLLYCVDFMGERGMQFNGKTVEVNSQIIDRLNRIYDTLWATFLLATRNGLGTDSPRLGES